MTRRSMTFNEIYSETPDPSKRGVDQMQLQRGRDGVNGRDGKDGIDGVDGIDGRDGIDGLPGPMGPQGPHGMAGSDTGEQIVKKLSELPKSDRLSYDSLKDTPDFFTRHQSSKDYAFTELTDAPHSLSGLGGKVIAIKADATGLEAVDGAGVSISEYDATIGATGADYTTLKGAIDAGKVRILAIGNTTETADIAVPSTGFYLLIKRGLTIAMGDFHFTYAAAANVTIRGQGTLSYLFTTDKLLFLNSSFVTSILDLEGITIDNNSTATSFSSLSGAVDHFRNIRIELPNASTGGIDGDPKSIYSDIELVGGGTSCELGMDMALDGAVASNIILSGTFKSSGFAVSIPRGSQIHGLFCTHSTNKTGISVGGELMGLYTTNQNIDLTLVGTLHVFLSDIDLKGGDLIMTSVDQAQINNFKTTGSITNPGSAAENNNFVNCRVTGAFTYGGLRSKFTDCDFLGGITVPSGADDNSFVNCQAGADAGGGVLTITVAAGANRTRIIGCATDAAISDAGTGTVTAANTVY